MTDPHASFLELVAGSPADLDEVMETMGSAFDPCFGEAWTRGQCTGILGFSGVWLLLARLDGQPAGFALARVVADEAELLLLAVPPDRRRTGVGRRMLQAVADEARARGATHLHLEMRDGNPAIFLYSAAGFRQVGRRPAYYRGKDGRAFDAITLSFPLKFDVMR